MTPAVRVLSAPIVNASGHTERGQKCTITQSSVKSAIYVDEADDITGHRQVANPINLNAVGQLEAFLAPGVYSYSVVDIDGGSAVTGTITVGDQFRGNVVAVQGKTTVAPIAWTAVPTLQNSWANKALFQAAQYRKDVFGIVQLRGTIDTGTKTAGTLITTLPAGSRPVTKQAFPVFNVVAATSQSVGEVIVDTDGTVKVGETTWAASSYASLNGIEFDTTA